jgi:hypothetical protein
VVCPADDACKDYANVFASRQLQRRGSACAGLPIARITWKPEAPRGRGLRL